MMQPFTKEQQLRGKPEKKKPGKIPYQSKAMQAKNSEYHRVLEEIDQEREPICQGCGKPEFEHSHSIPRNYMAHKFISNKKNIWRLCRQCHVDYEAGKIWDLKCGPPIMRNIWSLDHQYYRQKLAQVVKVVEKYKKDNWLQFSQGVLKLPEWLEELIKDF